MRGIFLICCLFIAALLRSAARELHNFGHEPDVRPIPSSQLPSHINVSDAYYGLWSQWSQCSRTCGIGISTRSRICHNRSTNTRTAESLCLGDSIDHKICKQQTCPPETADARELQCSRYNNRPIAGQQAQTWIPSNGGTNPCELRCAATGVVTGFGKVEDGTPCGGGVCLNGRCLKLGCDDRLGSGVVVDMCGICGGRNSTCVHYKDIFYGQPTSPQHERRSDYQEVAVIPAGSRNLEIRQKIGLNILAVRDRNVAILYHGQERQTPTVKSVAGTLLEYSVQDSNLTEVIRSSSPLMTELYVLVLLRERNAGVYYEYWLPQDELRSPNVRPAVTNQPKASQTATRMTIPSFSVAKLPSSPTRFFTTFTPTVQTYRRNSNYDLQNSKTSFNYGPKRHGIFYTQFQKMHMKPVFKVSKNEVHLSTEGEMNILPSAKPLLPPGMGLQLRTRKPVYNFYQKFRNHSHVQMVNDYQKPDLLTPQTQRDSGIPNGIAEKHRLQNIKEEKLYKHRNFTQFENPNVKWKYHLSGRTENVESKLYPTTPVSIAVFPLPESRNYTKTRRGRRRGLKRSSLSKAAKDKGLCAPCQRIRDQTKHFCTSDFVIRAIVLDYEFVNGEIRYELEVVQSFKNSFSLLPREYVWAPDTCHCPKMRIGKEYLLMGHSDNSYRRNESRLLVDRNSFVRNYNEKYTRRLQKLKGQLARKCSATRNS